MATITTLGANDSGATSRTVINDNFSNLNAAIPAGTLVSTDGTQTLTNKTVTLGGNTVTGTIAEFNTALTDADFATLAGTEALTNKTLTSSTNVLGGVTLTLGSDASYDTYYRNASGVLTRLANGTTGQVLSATTGAAPSWASSGNAWTTVKKTADESRQSNTTYTSDSTLQFSMLANTKYTIRIRAFYETPAAADFKGRANGPASPSLVHFVKLYGSDAAVMATTTSGTTDYSASEETITSTGTMGSYFLELTVHNGANAGTFSFQWAQATSTAGNTTVRAGSYLEYMTI